ncbi:methyltransferase [Flavobacterium sp. W21_SRS_FM6]|uniref:methyltransferase n=1 Tax=Flavobacterium sp. W21_SRS_FM6 TaxID=3240268 RepID=UPI003F909713
MKASLTLLDKSLTLLRYPPQLQHPSWQAWDAADEYLIEYVQSLPSYSTQSTISIYNDDFGALACWFAAHHISWISDSFVARQSCLMNLTKNGLQTDTIRFNHCLDLIETPSDIVLIKVPKTTALLEQQLIALQNIVTPTTQIIAAGKILAIQKSTLALFEKYLGPTTTSLAKKKARLIFCQPSTTLKHNSPYPTVWSTEKPAFRLINHANVFSRQQLDIGARFMLEHLPKVGNKTLIDLGCGNGVLGLHVLHNNQQARVIFVDESYMAIDSARENIKNNLPDALTRCDFIVSNCLDEYLQNSRYEPVDFVLCNPPFHQQNTITDHIALQMFSDAKKALTSGGELIIVGNRHLDYPAKLKRMFGGVKHTASNQKFSIYTATK